MKEWIEYRKNKKIVKYAVAKYIANLITDNARIMEIISYIATLTPKQIQKILVNATVETLDKTEE